MQYRNFGNTGIKVSILGFGAMRLPEEEIKGKYQVKEKESIDIIQRAFELGVNYVDTAYVTEKNARFPQLLDNLFRSVASSGHFNPPFFDP